MESAAERRTTSNKYYAALVALFVLIWIPAAGIQTNWSVAAGYICLPFIVAAVVMSRYPANAVTAVLIGSAVGAALVWQSYSNVRDDTQGIIYDSCVQQIIPGYSDIQKNAYCGCYADRMSSKMILYLGQKFVLFQPLPKDAAADAGFMSLMNEAASLCQPR